MRLDELELSAPPAMGLQAHERRGKTDMSAVVQTCRRLLAAHRFGIVLGALLLASALLRFFLPRGFNGVGFDEHLYQTYIQILDRFGVRKYPLLIYSFISNQVDPHHQAILPPTRILYILGGYFYHRLFGWEPLHALRLLSCHFSILTVGLSSLACWRMTRLRGLTLAVTALVACAPTQIHLAQHSLIDGVFVFWALLVVWLLWENLQCPNRWPWTIAYGAALAGLVLTKENAAFVFAVVLVMIATNRWLKLGSVTPRLVITTFAGALAGLAVVIVAAGGIDSFIVVFTLLKEKVPVLPYTIHTGGGPWHRYLVDLLLVSPLILLLAAANVLQPGIRRMPAQRYLTIFCCLIYALLTAFPDGMNLRYILALDMPLRFLAACQLFDWSKQWGRYRNTILACAVLALCGYDLRQHRVLFAKGELYELITDGLVRVQGIIR